MAALGSKAMAFVASKKDTVVSLLLFGSFAAMAVRSNEQQRQIEALEAEKSALRASNAAVSSAMWSWRQHLFHLAESPDCSSASAAGAAPFIPLARLRAIYGEDDPSASDLQQGQEDVAEESITIA